MPSSRRAIVLLHGVASNRTRWSEFVAHTALARSWPLLAPDLRGNGAFVDRGRIGMAQWCSDIAALLQEKGYAGAILVGHCLGANIALNFAVRHPERTLGLALIEPLPPAALAGTLARLRRLSPLLRLLAGAVRALNAAGIHRRALQRLDLEALDRATRAALARGPEGEAQLAKYASPLLDLRTTASAAYLQQLLAMTEELPAPDAIGVPVLALLAERSAFADTAKVRAYLERFPDREIAALPAKHWIPTEQPRAMREAIEDWVARRFDRAGSDSARAS